MTTTVSAKISDEMKDEIDHENISVSEVIRDALAAEIEERQREALQRDAAALRERIGDGIETDSIVDVVRETRREH